MDPVAEAACRLTLLTVAERRSPFVEFSLPLVEFGEPLVGV